MQVNSNSEIEKFIGSLNMPTAAKIDRTVALLEKFGFRLMMPHSKKITNNLFELRVKGQQEVRIIYCFYKNEIYLLTGFVKKTQTIPKRELERAEAKFKALTEYNL